MIIMNYHGQQDYHQMLLLFLKCMLILSVKSQDLIFSFKKESKCYLILKCHFILEFPLQIHNTDIFCLMV